MSTDGPHSEPAILANLASMLADWQGREYSAPIDRETLFFADLGLASIDAVVLGEELQSYYGQPIPFDRMMGELGQREDRDMRIGELSAFLARYLH